MVDDLTFITNEGENKLKKRFQYLINYTKAFDCLVGYFYFSGFKALAKELEKTKKIRILIGISTGETTYKFIKEAKQEKLDKYMSALEIKEQFNNDVIKEVENTSNEEKVETSVSKFKEWLNNGKLEIRVYPSEKLHAKMYVMTFDKDKAPFDGAVITGSSNLTYSGIDKNLELNVELRDPRDYNFAKNKFEELWKQSIDVSEEFVETVNKRTWLNDDLKPYELYLKFLYEYFNERINLDKDSSRANNFLPEGFMDLEYQSEAVNQAKSIIEKYGGVFLSDVVGVGKTFIATLLAKQLPGRTLVIAPPALVDDKNPGSWNNAFLDFGLAGTFKSLGRLHEVIRTGIDKYDNVIIDESHRFRNEGTDRYVQLARVCRGKKVILVSATPFNNYPKDILSQLKLFQKGKNSTIPNMRDLDSFFSKLQSKLNKLDRLKNKNDYLKIMKENGELIREKVLKYVMIRRTRNEIKKYFDKDLKTKGLKFPEVAEPTSEFYELNDYEDKVFQKTINIITKEFSYARYMPLIYYKKKLDQLVLSGQKNMGKFMKVLLIKRLESSFYAFRKSVERFIKSYELVINEFEKGNVYISADYIRKIFDFIDQGDDEAVQKLIDKGKAERYDAKDFKKSFITDLKNDLKVLNEIKSLWSKVKRDPKLDKFLNVLSSDKLLSKKKGNKIVLFTEFKDTAEYLKERINDKVLLFSGSSSSSVRERVIENFDANSRYPKDDYRILITTDVLAEGVNLHRSNIVVNYDIPWNPTRLMQRAGRVNRVDTSFDKIYSYTFFPTVQSNSVIKLREAAEAKISMFIEMLGNDARLLTDGEEIKSHDLFKKLTSKKTYTGEDEEEVSELEYLKVIRDVRDNDIELYKRVKRLPKKARSAKVFSKKSNALLTYFRKGKLQKFYLNVGGKSNEVDFFTAADILSCDKNTKRLKVGFDFHKFLYKNKLMFNDLTTEEPIKEVSSGGRSNRTILLKILKSKQVRGYAKFTDEEEDYIKEVVRLLRESALPDKLLKDLKNKLKSEKDVYTIYLKLRESIPSEFFFDTYAESAAFTSGPREVILSEYLVGGK